MRIRFVLGRRACLGVLTALVVGTLAVGVAQAHHIPGATYRGGLPNGGTLEFDVSADGTAISRFRITGSGDVCQGSLELTGLGDQVTNDGFNHPSADPLAFSGSFPSKQKAQGTLSLDITLPPPIGRCRTGVVSWTATTSAPATGSAECRNALASVNAAQVQANSAQAAATSAQNAVTAAQSAADTAGAAIAAATHKIKNVRKKLRKAGTSTAKKRLKKALKLDVKALANARKKSANASVQQQGAAVQQQDAANQQLTAAAQLQTAGAQQQAEC
jgi:hypothetical protein